MGHSEFNLCPTTRSCAKGEEGYVNLERYIGSRSVEAYSPPEKVGLHLGFLSRGVML